MDALSELGATLVLPEELETSVEIVSRVLGSYLVPRRERAAFIAEIRSGGYEMWRRPAHEAASMFELRETLTDLDISSMRADPNSEIAGQRLADSDLRRLFGVTVLAIRRQDELVANPGDEEIVRPGDTLVLMGLGEEMAAAYQLFRGRGG